MKSCICFHFFSERDRQRQREKTTAQSVLISLFSSASQPKMKEGNKMSLFECVSLAPAKPFVFLSLYLATSTSLSPPVTGSRAAATCCSQRLALRSAPESPPESWPTAHCSLQPVHSCSACATRATSTHSNSLAFERLPTKCPSCPPHFSSSLLLFSRLAIHEKPAV